MSRKSVHLLSKHYAVIHGLENIIERAVNLADQDFITSEQLPRQIFENLSNTSSNAWKDSNEKPESSVLTYPAQSNLDLFLQELIQVLHDEKGNISQAAKHFNISKRTLYRKINKYQINLKDFRFWTLASRKVTLKGAEKLTFAANNYCQGKFFLLPYLCYYSNIPTIFLS